MANQPALSSNPMNKIDTAHGIFPTSQRLRYSLNPARNRRILTRARESDGYADSSGRQGPHLRGKY